MDPATIMMLLQTVGPMLQQKQGQQAQGQEQQGIMSSLGGLGSGPLNPQKMVFDLLKDAYTADRKKMETINPFASGTVYKHGGNTAMAKQHKLSKKDYDEVSNIIEYKEGGIHIKPENRGKFTAWAKARGMDVQQAASHIMANKENYSPTIIKRANFAKNAAGWSHKDGGYTSIMEMLKNY